MARKEASFASLVAYITRDACDQNYNLHHNMLGHRRQELIAEFNDNAKLLNKRKGANMMYHEIVSIKRPKGLSDARQKAALRDIAGHYVKARAPDCLVFGGMHDDHDDHLHYHLAISANPLGLSKRHWLTKAQFRQVTIGLERRVLRNYPELEQTIAIEKTAAIKLSKKAHTVKVHKGRLSKREALGDDLKALFATVTDIPDLRAQMSRRNLEFYVRGKSVGIVDLANSRKHRLKTLELMPVYQEMAARLTGNRAQVALVDQFITEPTQPTKARKKTLDTQPQPEASMDPISTIVQGIGVVSDLVSLKSETDADMSREKPDASEIKDEQQIERVRQKKVEAQKKKTDREIIAEAHRAEMEDLQKHRQQQRGNSLSRKR